MESVIMNKSQFVENTTSMERTSGVNGRKTSNDHGFSANQGDNMEKNRLPFYPISYENKKVSIKLKKIKIPVQSRNQAKKSRKDQHSEPQTPQWNNNSSNQGYCWGDALQNTRNTTNTQTNMGNVSIGTVSMKQHLQKSGVSSYLSKDKISDVNNHDDEDSEYESDKENGYPVHHGVNRGSNFKVFKPFELIDNDAYVYRDNKIKKYDLRYQTPCTKYQVLGDRNSVPYNNNAQALTRSGNIFQTIVDERKNGHAYNRVGAPRRTILGLKSNCNV